jgi:hypothetical protein
MVYLAVFFQIQLAWKWHVAIVAMIYGPYSARSGRFDYDFCAIDSNILLISFLFSHSSSLRYISLKDIMQGHYKMELIEDTIPGTN